MSERNLAQPSRDLISRLGARCEGCTALAGRIPWPELPTIMKLLGASLEQHHILDQVLE
jgi:hypothetical protein